MPRPDPYAEYLTEERDLFGALISPEALGATGGVVAAMRFGVHADSAAARRALRTRNPAWITEADWWATIWARFESRTDSALRLVSRRAGKIAHVPPLSGEEAAEIAARTAGELADVIRSSTEAGLHRMVREIAKDKGTAAELVEELASRLGPTPKQQARISRWKRAALARGDSATDIARGVARQTRAASLARARAFASEALVRQASETLTEMYAEAGVLVSSGNPLDANTRDAHAEQTAVTRSSPTPAGEPWAAGAPFDGLPPYEIMCRCYVERAGSVSRRQRPKQARERSERQEERASEILKRDRVKAQHAWVHGSRNIHSVHLQEAVRQELGVGLNVWNPKKHALQAPLVERYRAAVREMYAETQAALPSGSFVRLYRGSQSSTSAWRGVLESWTDDPAIARKFGGSIITVEVPREQVFMFSGGPGWVNSIRYGEQREWVILGRRPQ